MAPRPCVPAPPAPAAPAGQMLGAILPASHVSTVGVRRTAFGKVGKVVNILVNAFPTTVPRGMIYHYDGIILHFSLIVCIIEPGISG